MLLVSLSTLAALGIVFQAYYISQIISSVFLLKSALYQVLLPLVLLLSIMVLRAVLPWLNEIVANRAATVVKSSLREQLFAHVLLLGPNYARGERSGELVNTAVEGIESLDAYIRQFLPQIVATVLIPLVVIGAVFATDMLSGLILLVTIPLLPFFMILIGKKANALTKQQWAMMGQMSAHFLDVLQGIITLKLFGRSQAQRETVEHISDRFRVATLKVLRVAFLSSLVMEMGATISTALIAVEIGLRLLYGQMPFERAFFALLLTPEFYLPLRSLGANFHASMSGSAAALRIFKILETPALPGMDACKGTNLNSPEIPDSSIQSLQLSNVHYTYQDSEENRYEALKGVSFQMHAGETVALVGASGAGKSTLASLLLRFSEPDQGEIRVDGRPLQDWPVRLWRQQVAWVPQRPYLFNATIAENIRLGRAEATLDEVIMAAKQAHLHEYIQGLPQQYETMIGERGTRLSGGQAQRLSIARAFLRNAPLFILDEATSTLDSASEAQVLKALRTLSRGRMVLVIAHRLHTIYEADRIVVLNEGRVSAIGTHQGLLQSCAVYQQLVQAYEEERAVA